MFGFNRATKPGRKSLRRKAPSCKPFFETLEDRIVPSGGSYLEDFNSGSADGWFVDGATLRLSGGAGAAVSGYLEGRRDGFVGTYFASGNSYNKVNGNLEALYGNKITISYDGNAISGPFNIQPTHLFFDGASAGIGHFTTYWDWTMAPSLDSFRQNWGHISFTIDTNWTDAQAQANGWRRELGNASWSATLHDAVQQPFAGLHFPQLPGTTFVTGLDNFQIQSALTDIAMQPAKLVGNTVQFSYQTTGNPGPFQVGLYRSADGITYDPSNPIQATQTFTPGTPGQTIAGTIVLNSTLTPDLSKPFLVVVADPPSAGKPKGDIIESNDTDVPNNNNVAAIQLPDLFPSFDNSTLHKLIYRGQTLSIPLLLNNQGGDAAGKMNIEYYLSQNQNADITGDTRFDPILTDQPANVSAGAQIEPTPMSSVMIPTDLRKGTYYLKVKLVPTTLQDNNLSNNVAVSQALTECSNTNSMTGDRAAFFDDAVTIAKGSHSVDNNTIQGFIKSNEGFDWKVNSEPNGDLVIGYGFDLTTGGQPHDKEDVKTTIAMFNLTNLQGKPLRYDDLLKKNVDLHQPDGIAFADKLFQLGFAEAQKAVTQEIHGFGSLTFNQQKALLDMAYNLGQGRKDKGLHGFTKMIKDIADGDFACAGFELIDSNRTDQLLAIGAGPRVLADFLLLVSGHENQL